MSRSLRRTASICFVIPGSSNYQWVDCFHRTGKHVAQKCPLAAACGRRSMFRQGGSRRISSLLWEVYFDGESPFRERSWKIKSESKEAASATVTRQAGNRPGGDHRSRRGERARRVWVRCPCIFGSAPVDRESAETSIYSIKVNS